MKRFAARTHGIANVGAFAIWEKAMALEAQGQSIIHLELGEPDFDTPSHIVEAAARSMAAGRTRYDSAIGTLALREAVADYLNQSRQTTIDPATVMITPGVKGALFFAMQALIEPGDEVLIPDPGYPPYGQLVRIAGGKPVAYPLQAEHEFQPQSADLQTVITPRTKLIVLNSPANPTGTIHTTETLQAVADIALRHDLWVLSDEIYHRLHFTPDPPPTIYTLPGMAERTILCDGFSKPYAMTGWRLGYGVFPPALVDIIATLMVNDHSSLPPFIQDAGVVALTSSQQCVDDMVAAYRRRRDRALQLLTAHPQIDYTKPDGAFYLMLNLSKVTDDVNQFAEQLLERGVAMLPGAAFGERGRGFLRVAFSQSEAQIEKALRIFSELVGGR